MQLEMGSNCPCINTGIRSSALARAAGLFSPEIMDRSDMSIPPRRELREAGVTFRKTATGHLKGGRAHGCEREKALRDLQDIVVEGGSRKRVREGRCRGWSTSQNKVALARAFQSTK